MLSCSEFGSIDKWQLKYIYVYIMYAAGSVNVYHIFKIKYCTLFI